MLATETSLDIRRILDTIPHRYPFVMIDRIVEFISDNELVAIKNVTINEPFFQGHFPGNPVMPGVLQLAAMAQAAATRSSRGYRMVGRCYPGAEREARGSSGRSRSANRPTSPTAMAPPAPPKYGTASACQRSSPFRRS